MSLTRVDDIEHAPIEGLYMYMYMYVEDKISLGSVGNVVRPHDCITKTAARLSKMGRPKRRRGPSRSRGGAAWAVMYGSGKDLKVAIWVYMSIAIRVDEESAAINASCWRPVTDAST